jgi:hypothetical protein
MAAWSILQPICIFCDHMVYFLVVWYIFPRFGMLSREKSGNPAENNGCRQRQIPRDMPISN